MSSVAARFNTTDTLLQDKMSFLTHAFGAHVSDSQTRAREKEHKAQKQQRFEGPANLFSPIQVIWYTVIVERMSSAVK